ncbi:MAG: hypothetical protein QOF72_1878, partial [Blastocatellia bacterium]|nr:hypothetical protein [Blastocatellia bacterium]
MTIDSTNGKMLLKPLPAFLLLLLPLLVFAQNGTPAPKPATADQFAGSYKGTAKDPGGAIALTLEIKSENGKIWGRLVAPKSEQSFTSSELVDGNLTAKFGSGDTSGTLVLRLRDNKLVGDWKAGGQTRPVEFERVPANPAVAEVKKPTAPPAADLLSGDWDAAADAQGQAVPFTLSLKVEGEKVTGTSVSQLGDSTISSGSWKDGKLAVVLDS